MPIKQLAELYDRICSNENNTLAYYGFEEKTIAFIIIIDAKGNFKGIRDTRVNINGNNIAKKYCIPKSEIRTSGARANLLWDKYDYVLNENHKAHAIFKQKIYDVARDLAEDIAVNAVSKFYENKKNIETLKNSRNYKDHEKDIKTAGIYISFQLIDEPIKLCCQSDKLINWQKSNFAIRDKNNKSGKCIITAKNTVIAEKHFPIKLPGSSDNVLLASVNKDSGRSYNKHKGYNFPVSDEITFKYTTALQYLLYSQQKIIIGDMILVFWAKDRHLFETTFNNIFSEDKYSINSNSEKLLSYFNSLYSGAYYDMEDNKKNEFYMLGLSSPGKGRVAINFWLEGTIPNINKNIISWFKDLELSGNEYFGYPSLPTILNCITTSKKLEQQALTSFMFAIFYNKPLPLKYLQQCLTNIHLKDEKTFYFRACFIKAALNRKYRLGKTKEIIPVSLDKENKEIGYLLGRLFATYEQLQQQAHNRETSTNLKSRYYSGLKNTPKRVLSILDDLASIYLDKLRKNKQLSLLYVFNSVVDSIYNMLEPESLPNLLNFDQRCLFVIGYKHQKVNLKSKIHAIQPSKDENTEKSTEDK